MTEKQTITGVGAFDSGFICMPRSFTKWEWYTDTCTRVLFEHLMMTANWEDKKWRGLTVKRGQRVCSVATLSKETGLTVRNIRTALDHLRATSEVTNEPTGGEAPKCTVFTVLNYEKYQSPTNETANHRQITDRSSTNHRQRLNNYNNYNNKNNYKNNGAPARESVSFLKNDFESEKTSVSDFALEMFTERPD